MPGFDGTGPQGQGPMTGRGEGYCAVALPSPGEGRAPYGYAGLQGTPVVGRRFADRVRPLVRLGRALRRRRGRARNRW